VNGEAREGALGYKVKEVNCEARDIALEYRLCNICIFQKKLLKIYHCGKLQNNFKNLKKTPYFSVLCIIEFYPLNMV